MSTHPAVAVMVMAAVTTAAPTTLTAADAAAPRHATAFQRPFRSGWRRERRQKGMGMSGGTCDIPYDGECLDACGSYDATNTWDNTFDACGNKARLTSLTLRYLGRNFNDLAGLRANLPIGPDGVQKQPDDKLFITTPGPDNASPVAISTSAEAGDLARGRGRR